MAIPPRIVPAAKNLLERVPELRTEDCIDDGIERGVEVAQPETDGLHVLVHEVGVYGQNHRHHEERQPAEHEGSGDDGQRLGRLAFPLGVHAVPGLPLDGVVLGLVGDAAVGRRRQVDFQAVGERGLLRTAVVGGDVREGRGRF